MTALSVGVPVAASVICSLLLTLAHSITAMLTVEFTTTAFCTRTFHVDAKMIVLSVHDMEDLPIMG